MCRKIILAVIFSLNFFLIQSINGQSDRDSTFRRLFKNITEFYGNVFLDTTYLKTDTLELQKMYPTELGEELELARIYGMKLIDFSFGNLNQFSSKIKNAKEFYDLRYFKIDLSAEDSIIIDKEDSFHSNIEKHSLNKKISDSLQKAENLLILSTFSHNFRTQLEKSKPKLMRVLGVFETDKMYLFIYHFMMLQGYPHYYVKSDLILK